MFTRLLKIASNQSIFLFGPRGTGKSTLVKKKFKKAIYIDLLEGDNYTGLLANPSRLETMIPAGYKNHIIIDEIQRIPDLLNEVHRLIETSKYKFILTGSSARKLRKKGVNLLAGRALTYNLYPLTIKELKDKFSLDHSLKFGNLPMVYKNNINAKKYLSSYIKTYLREEILQEGLVRNLEPFSRFLEAASFSQGSTVNITEIARECSVNRKVVENYFSILEDLLIGDFLHVFTKKAKRRMVSHPKFYFFDVGVYRSIRPTGPLDKPEEIEGISFETLFYQELKAINDYYELEYKIFYWRTSNQMEVDFIVYGEKGIKAFEIKRSGKFKKRELSGLKTFSRDYPMAKLYFVYGGNNTYHEDNINIIPFEKCIKSLKKLLTS